MPIANILNSVFSRPKTTSKGSFGLNEFSAELGKSGFARTSYFTVMITPPSKLLEIDSKVKDGFGKPMSLRIEQAELPARAPLYLQQRYYGPLRNIPYGYNSQQLTLTIILSEDMRERNFFLRWQDLLLGQSRLDEPSARNIPGLFDVGYYDTATKDSDVTLSVYATSPNFQTKSKPASSLFDELSGVAQAVGFDPTVVTDPFGLNIFGGGKDRDVESCYKIKLIEPFPAEINAIPMSWADDGYGKLQVQMQYRYFVEKHETFSEPTESLSIAKLVRDGVDAFNRFKPVFSLIKGQGGVGSAGRAAFDQVSGGGRAAATAAVRPF